MVYDSLDFEGDILDSLFKGGIKYNDPQLSLKRFVAGEGLASTCIGSNFDFGMKVLGELEVLWSCDS